jgi:DMSO reductase anchor subunit
MCHSRLAEGEAPACVQACPTHAIRIVTVTTHVNGTARADTSAFLSAAPDPVYTQPTTRYLSRRGAPKNLTAADAFALRPQPPHWPLAVMLTLLPAAVGLFTAAAFLPLGLSSFVTDYVTNRPALSPVSPVPSVAYYVTLAGWGLGAIGLAASGFHLGQPRRAWRIFLGWRRSWLSREAMVFGAWFGLASAALVAPRIVPLAVLVGVVGLFCSVMIYVDTRRTFWRLAQTAPRFFGTAAVVGFVPVAPGLAALLLLAKLGWEARTLQGESMPARLQRGPLRTAAALRGALGLAACGLLATSPGWFAFVVLLAGELGERSLFFRAVDAPKMPGMPA